MIDLYTWLTPNGRKVSIIFEEFPHVKRWFDAISSRPAVQRGMAVPVD